MNFIRAWQSLPEYGVSLFVVRYNLPEYGVSLFVVRYNKSCCINLYTDGSTSAVYIGVPSILSLVVLVKILKNCCKALYTLLRIDEN